MEDPTSMEADTSTQDDFVRRVRQLRIGDKYQLIRRLGSGTFGAVYLGKDVETDQDVALKLSHSSQDPILLEQEVSTYEDLSGSPGFPEVYWLGGEQMFTVMAFELLGPNLEDLLRFCGDRFSLKTTLLIADQLLDRFETLHAQEYLHRDIKPENFLLGILGNANLIYMTDLGLATSHVLRVGVPSAPSTKIPGLIGTARYASINSHLGNGQSPRDDLESLGYMLIYFMHGRLPWQGLRASTREEKYALILEMKKSTPVSRLGAGLPREFGDYMEYVQALRYDEQPDYELLRQAFRQLFRRSRFENDNVFDWTIEFYLRQRAGRSR